MSVSSEEISELSSVDRELDASSTEEKVVVVNPVEKHKKEVNNVDDSASSSDSGSETDDSKSESFSDKSVSDDEHGSDSDVDDIAPVQESQGGKMDPRFAIFIVLRLVFQAILFFTAMLQVPVICITIAGVAFAIFVVHAYPMAITALAVLLIGLVIIEILLLLCGLMGASNRKAAIITDTVVQMMAVFVSIMFFVVFVIIDIFLLMNYLEFLGHEADASGFTSVAGQQFSDSVDWIMIAFCSAFGIATLGLALLSCGNAIIAALLSVLNHFVGKLRAEKKAAAKKVNKKLLPATELV